MYYIIYYYLNLLSITDCNVIKNIPRKTFNKTSPKRKSWIRHYARKWPLMAGDDASAGYAWTVCHGNMRWTPAEHTGTSQEMNRTR
jgi:hypothetical protein